MIEDIKKDARNRMSKSIEAFQVELSKIRTGRAHPSLLNHITVDFYGSEVPIGQSANITVEDARTLAVTPWDKSMVSVIEKAIMKSDLGLNPSTAGHRHSRTDAATHRGAPQGTGQGGSRTG